MSTSIDIDAFKWRLAETIAWCVNHASVDNPRDCLRDHQLRPPSFWYPTEVYPRQAIVEALATRRAAQLLDWRGNNPVKEPASDLAGGRLLLYYPYANLDDGASESESHGFFDINNEPPWDTWVCFVQDGQHGSEESYDHCLVSWIPPQMIGLADAGISVNAEASIIWAADVSTWAIRCQTPFTRQLKETGLLG